LTNNTNDSIEREKLCYQQNFEQFRSLNQIMWQVPIIAMTLTGGLWFGVAKIDAQVAQIGLLALAVLGNSGLIAVLHRTRFVMGEYLKKIKEFCPEAYVEAKGEGPFEGGRTVVLVFQILLALSALLSLAGICLIGHSGWHLAANGTCNG
jgi:hypothetical protein